jgi:hypothetical protein
MKTCAQRYKKRWPDWRSNRLALTIQRERWRKSNWHLLKTPAWRTEQDALKDEARATRAELLSFNSIDPAPDLAVS